MQRRTFLKSLSMIVLPVWAGISDVTFYIKEKLHLVHTIEIHDESTEGGIIKCFADSYGLRRAEIEQCWESGKYLVQYSVDRTQNLSRVCEREIHYNRPFYWTKESAEEVGDTEYHDPTKFKVIDREFWYDDGNLIHAKTTDAKELHTEFFEMKTERFKKRLRFILDHLSNNSENG